MSGSEMGRQGSGGPVNVENVARSRSMPVADVVAYRDLGLLEPFAPSRDSTIGAMGSDEIAKLDRLEDWRARYGSNVRGMYAICHLLVEVDRLQSELESIRAG